MSTNDSPSLNNNRKLTASFSSPEFNESSLASSVDGASESSNVTSTLNTINSSGSGRSNQLQTTITTSNSNSMIKSCTNNTTTGIKLNTTRDSGFSDSLIEDSTSSSNSQFLTRSETLDASAKAIAKLNSVVEDNAIVDKNDDLSKEFITIVKTTKVTTKVKHIKTPAAAAVSTTTKQSNGKKKNNKKNKNKIEKIDENRQLAEIVTEIITENESTISANINGSNQIINGNIQASKSVTQTTTNGDAKNITQLKIQEDDERTSSSESNNNDIYDEEDEEDSQLAELNGLQKPKKKQQQQLVKDESTVIKVNINKSTEELVFQALPPNKSLNKLKEQDQKDSLATTTYSTTQHLSTTLSSDLNTSMLDSEELLSDYSASHNPTQLDMSAKQPDLNASFSSSIKEIPNVIDIVLNDVTNSNAKETNDNKRVETPDINATTTTTSKADKKKKRKFNIFSKGSRDSKRKLNKKDDLLVESPSKQARKETNDIKNLISLYNDTIRYQLLDEEQKERIMYLKEESIDLLMNYFVQFESNSNTKSQLTNLHNQPSLDGLLRKMLARSLDLLNHDKIESFDKLAAQLKLEYQVNDALQTDEIVDENFDFNALNSTTNDLVFKNLIQEALIDKKLLLNLNVDKSHRRPCEEIIEFSSVSSNATSTPLVRPPVLRPTEKQEEDKVQEILKVEPITKEEQEQVKEEETSIQIEQVRLEEPKDARIVLDTIKEPPIIFPSDLESKTIVEQPKVVEQVEKVATLVAEETKPIAIKSSKKRPSKKRAGGKKSSLSCIACGANSIKKSEEELNKLDEKPDQTIKTEEQQITKPVVEDLSERHREIFSNLDSKPGDQTIEELKQTDENTIIETNSPQAFKIEVESIMDNNNKNEEEQIQDLVSPTPPSTPEVLAQIEPFKLDEQQPPIVEVKQEALVQPVIETKSAKKKQKNAKKQDKMKITNEIQLNSSGLVDVSVLDVKIETIIEPEVKSTSIDLLPVQTIAEAETEPTKINITSGEEPVKISIRNIQMENEQSEIEHKSFSELVEITQTIVGQIEENEVNELPVYGSNLDIKTEIDIGIEKEIFKEQSTEEIKPVEVKETKAVKSDDIVVLPEPQVHQQQSPIEVTSIVIDTPKVEEVKETKKEKVKKEKKTKASCFSCRAKKAKKSKDEAKQPILEADTNKDSAPPLALVEEESKIAVESLKLEEKPIKLSNSENSNLFVGLDRASDKPLDVPSLYTIELNEKTITTIASTTANLGAEQTVNQTSEKIISPSMIGSTSLESNQDEINANIKVEEVELETPKQVELETTEEKIETPKQVESETTEEKIETPKQEEIKILSDDVVVLPEPVVRNEVKIESVQVAKKEEEAPKKEEEPKVKKPKKKKSTTSCFPKSKAKKDKPVLAETKPADKPVQLKLDEPDLTAATVSVVAVEHKIVENWAIGLDRRDSEVVERRDPIDYAAPTEKEEQKPTEDIVEVVSSSEQIKDEPTLTEDKNEQIEQVAPVEIKEEPVEVKVEVDETQQETKDSTEGSWIVIDRAPDHAVIPDMTKENLIKSTLESTQPAVEEIKVESSQPEKNEKQGRKTTRIDMPLISLCAAKPKAKKEKKKKAKKQPVEKAETEQVIKKDSEEKLEVVVEQVVVASKEEPKQVEEKQKRSTGILDMPLIDLFKKRSKSKQPIEETKPKVEEVIAKPQLVVEEVLEAPVELSIEEIETKKVVEEIIAQIEEASKPVIEETKPEEPAIVHIKLDREPDVVKLPDPNEIKQMQQIESKLEIEQKTELVTSEAAKPKEEKQKRATSILDMPLIDLFKKRSKSKQPKVEEIKETPKEEKIETLKVEESPKEEEVAEDAKKEVDLTEPKVVVEEVLSTAPAILTIEDLEKEKEELVVEEAAPKEEATKLSEEKQKRTTSILDMPLINILRPKDQEKKQKKKKGKDATKKTEIQTVEKPKEQIPELLIIDVPTLDIVKPEEHKEEQIITLQEEIKPAEIPVPETSLDKEVKLESEQIKQEEVPLKQLDEPKADTGVDDGSWVIIDRPPDHAIIPIVSTQQPTVEITKAAEVVVTAETKAEETKPVETKNKKSKSKKPISCFSCKAKSAKKQQELANEPQVAPVELKQTEETKQTEAVVVKQAEFVHDFSGLDRRDSQEPIKFEPPEALLEQQQIQVEIMRPDEAAPKEEVKTENIEEIIKEELKEVDKQYAEFTSKLIEKSETNVETFEAIAEQVVSIVNETETVTSEVVTEKYELEIETKVVEANEVDEATKRLDDVLEKAEIEIKKLDESFDIKIKEEEVKETKAVKSDDIVVLPEPQVHQQQSPIEVTSIVIDTPKVEEVKETKKEKVKKEKKTKASCFSCRAKKARETQDKLGEKALVVEDKPVKIDEPLNIAAVASSNEPAPISPTSQLSYDPNLFKGLDRLDDSQLIKEPVNLDAIKVESPVLTTPIKQDDIVFNEVIQEIIVETSKLAQEENKTDEEIVVVEVKQTELDQSKVEQVEPVVVVEEKKQIENLNVSLEIPSDQALCEPQASSSPKKLSDDIVVLPEPVDRTLTQQQIATQETSSKPVTAEQQQQPDEIKAAKKPNSFVSFLCGKKSKTSTPKKEKTKKKNKAEKQKEQVPVVTEPLKLDDLETREPIPLNVTSEPQQEKVVPEETPSLTPVLPLQPPKKPPRGHLDTSVIENDIETLIPQTVVTDSTSLPQLDASQVDPQVTQPLKIEIIESNESSQQKSPVVNVISEQKIQTTNITTSLLSTSESKSVQHISSSTVTETKVIEYPSVIDFDPALITPKQRVTTWTTDPLPHVQIGSHRINTNEEIKLEAPKTEQPDTKVETKIEEPQQQKVETVKVENETIKVLSSDEVKLLKSKEKEAIEYLKQKAGYTITSSSTKQEKELEKIATKLFKKGVKVIVKNDSKQATTYSKLNKKLTKEVSIKKYSNEITKCTACLKEEFESGNLLSHLRSDKTQEAQQQTFNENQPTSESNTQETTKEETSNSDKLNVEPQIAMKRCPSLTWREANERARILFYKGRVPSIHYNEKRDSFRVSMITSVSTNGTEKTTEVPVCDDDVRRLLNSCGLYWNGESISLLNKSDDIFSIAQQEAFDILQLINNNN